MMEVAVNKLQGVQLSLDYSFSSSRITIAPDVERVIVPGSSGMLPVHVCIQARDSSGYDPPTMDYLPGVQRFFVRSLITFLSAPTYISSSTHRIAEISVSLH